MAPLPDDVSFERLRSRRERKARRGRLAAATFSLILAAGAIGGAMLAFRAGTGNTTRPQRVAAGPSVDLSVGPDQYAYEKVVDLSYGPEGDGAHWPLYVEQQTGRSWYRVDDSGRSWRLDHLDFFSPGDRDTYVQQMGDPPPAEQPEDNTYAPDNFPQDVGNLSSLSTDPIELRAQLLDRSGTGGASPQPGLSPGPGQGPDTPVLWAAIQTMLGSPAASPALRAALFEVARELQGVDVTSGTTDPVGRPATLLTTVNAADIQSEWWFDPASEQMMAWRATILSTSMVYPKGTVSLLRIILASGVTDATGDGAALVKSFVSAPVTDPPALPDPRA
jgi:hypothetical protein